MIRRTELVEPFNLLIIKRFQQTKILLCGFCGNFITTILKNITLIIYDLSPLNIPETDIKQNKIC